MPPRITTQQVRQWLGEAAPRRAPLWPEFQDHDLEAIANACNRERTSLDLKEVISPKLSEFRQCLQSTRTAADCLLAELPTIMEYYKGCSTKDDIEELSFLKSVKATVKKLKDRTESSRLPGGQTKPHVDFACRLAVHVRQCLADHGIKASSKEEGPLISFVEKAVGAVFDSEHKPAALAKAVARHLRQQ